MVDNIVKLNETTSNEISDVSNITSQLPVFEEEINGSNYTKLPISRLASLGVAFQPLATAVQTVVTGAGGSGIYYVNTAGKTMFQMKETGNFIGSLKSTSGLVGGGQAQITPLACDPTMLFMAAALANIDKKLDAIKEMQQEMMDFLVQKEKSELRGSLTFLYDVFSNYRFNWNNEMFKENNHSAVLSIKREAEEKIIFYRKQIEESLNKKVFFHSDRTVDKQLQTVQDKFKDCQLSLYMLGFSTFLDVILLENYDREYLQKIAEKLDTYSLNYRELYSRCYDEIANYSSTSFQSTFLKGLSKTVTGFGKLAEKIPVVSNTQADETLIAAGDRISDFSDEKLRKQMKMLIERQSNFVRPFIDNIDKLNELHNQPVEILVDKDNLYISADKLN